MREKIRIGFVGCGQFCKFFVPLFKAHPAVEFVAVTDKFPERCKEYDEKFGVDSIKRASFLKEDSIVDHAAGKSKHLNAYKQLKSQTPNRDS